LISLTQEDEDEDGGDFDLNMREKEEDDGVKVKSAFCNGGVWWGGRKIRKGKGAETYGTETMYKGVDMRKLPHLRTKKKNKIQPCRFREELK
jgi:hypothetical protein